MTLKLNTQDRVAIAGMYIVPITTLFASMAMAFEHAQDWAERHAVHGAPGWQGWAFACMVELVPTLGLLLLFILKRIGGKLTVARLLFFGGAAISFTVQQGYAGANASPSERIVAGAPSIAAMVFIELLLWVIGLIDEAKARDIAEQVKRDMAATRPVIGVHDIPTPPSLSPRREPSMSPPTPAAVSPDISAPRQGDTGTAVTPDRGQRVAATAAWGDSDIPQVEAGDSDTEADAAPDGQGDMTDPRRAEAAQMRRRGDTVAAIAKHFRVAPRTVQRWKLPNPDDTKPLNGHVPELSGVKN